MAAGTPMRGARVRIKGQPRRTFRVESVDGDLVHLRDEKSGAIDCSYSSELRPVMTRREITMTARSLGHRTEVTASTAHPSAGKTAGGRISVTHYGSTEAIAGQRAVRGLLELIAERDRTRLADLQAQHAKAHGAACDCKAFEAER